MSDLFPQVYMEKRVGREWRPAAGRDGAALRYDHALPDEAWWVLMALTRAVCPEGADFCAAHERAFAQWSDRERARLDSEGCPVDEDIIFGASALDLDDLRALATDAPPDLLLSARAEQLTEPPAPAVWTALAGELRRWITVMEDRGAQRVVLWYGT